MFLQFSAAIATLGICVAAVRKWPMSVLWVTAAFAVVAWEIPSPPSLASIGGAEVKIEDAIFVIFALDVMLRPQRFVTIIRRYALVAVVLALCLIASLISGILIFGPAAINEARAYIWGIGLVAWMLNSDWSNADMQKQFRWWATVVGWVLVAVFAYHALRYGMGTADSFVEFGDGEAQTGRPLISQQAILLACLGFILFWRTHNFKPKVFSGLVFITVAMLCQHRSVWLAVALGALLVLPKIRGKALGNTVFWALYGCIILAALFLVGAFDSLIEQIAYAATSAGTYMEREASWQLLIERAVAKGPSVVLFGEPFGAGYDRTVNGKFVTYSPHNWFVMIFLRLGLAGFMAYVVVVGLLVVPKLARSQSVACAALIAVLTYSWTYSMPWYMSPVIGWCIYEAWRDRTPGLPPSTTGTASLPHKQKMRV
jgi:hypothetical protein